MDQIEQFGSRFGWNIRAEEAEYFEAEGYRAVNGQEFQLPGALVYLWTLVLEV